MGSELILLSSDDEDDILEALRPAKLHRKSQVLDADNDVMVIEKVSCLESRRMEKSTLALFPLTANNPPSDDDCCILNHDPENNVQVPFFQANDADDLVVVGERGPVACRDFPHARHLCAKFPFTTTSHEKYCEQCHCYVCDVLAPCLLWGQGKQSSDHCHAFDKDEKWKKMRNHARSMATKPGAKSHAPIRQGQVIQPQPRTNAQAPLRVTLRTGVKSSATHSDTSANVPSINQYLVPLPANWPLNVQSKMGTMLANDSHGNRASVGGMNIPFVGNSYVDASVVPSANNRRRSSNENNCSISSNALGTATSCALQQMGYQAPLHPAPIYGSTRITQVCSPRQGATHNPSFTSTPLQQNQEQGPVGLTVAPCRFVERLGGTPDRIPGRPYASTLSRIGKDLMTLQGYLMEGITGESQGQSSVHSSETDCLQVSPCGSGTSSSNVPYEMPVNRDSERSYNPFEPSVIPLCNDVDIGNTQSQMANTQASVQVSKIIESMPASVAASQDTAEKPLCSGGGTDMASSLDQLLADFDDEIWTLFEPPFPGF